MIRVVIADDHQVVRRGLAFLLSSEPGIEVAGEAADGAAALAAIRALRPDVVLLDLFMPGVDGMAVLTAVVESVRAAARGQSVLQPAATTRLIEELSRGTARDPLRLLLPREIEVLREVARGRPNRDIARTLSVSEATVKTHVSNILAKLSLADRTQAAIFGLQHHIVPLDQALDP